MRTYSDLGYLNVKPGSTRNIVDIAYLDWLENGKEFTYIKDTNPRLKAHISMRSQIQKLIQTMWDNGYHEAYVLNHPVCLTPSGREYAMMLLNPPQTDCSEQDEYYKSFFK